MCSWSVGSIGSVGITRMCVAPYGHAARRGDALIVLMAAPAQTQAEATGSCALAAGQVRRQVKPEGA
jgi:hypothetical protein